MELSSWCNSGITNNMDAYVKGRRYDRIVSFDALMVQPKKARWRLLWRKIMREKKKFLDCSSSRVQFSYDSYAYSQNFDQGSMWADPDTLSRSFSARFAVPARIFEKNSEFV